MLAARTTPCGVSMSAISATLGSSPMTATRPGPGKREGDVRAGPRHPEYLPAADGVPGEQGVAKRRARDWCLAHLDPACAWRAGQGRDESVVDALHGFGDNRGEVGIVGSWQG